jgi:hypothetical protein
MESQNSQAVVNITVMAHVPAIFSVFEEGFEHPIAQFKDMPAAKHYALQFAQSKPRWKVSVYDSSGALAGTYHSDDAEIAK